MAVLCFFVITVIISHNVGQRQDVRGKVKEARLELNADVK